MTHREGDTVILTRKKSVNHFIAGNMTIIGVIEKVDRDHHDGIHRRPYLIRFTDGRASWWKANEFRKERR